jgi:hypothetical protein
MAYPEIDWQTVARIDAHLDDNVAEVYKQQPLAQDWARISKVTEERGEAIAELIGMTGQNPRKGVHSTRERLYKELCDVIATGILALQHFTKDEDITAALIADHINYLWARIQPDAGAVA